jgi:hypothetical protein
MRDVAVRADGLLDGLAQVGFDLLELFVVGLMGGVSEL